MKRARAQEIVDQLYDKEVEQALNGLRIELRDTPNATDNALQKYTELKALHDKVHALQTDFVTKNFKE